MYGAIIGDIVGSKYEFNNIKTKDFPLFSSECNYTDDTIMTVAVAKAIMLSRDEQCKTSGNGRSFFDILVEVMRDFGRRYPHPMGAYGSRFSEWLTSAEPQPYGSYGNGSAMRVSPCALAAVNLDEALEMARISAAVTHNHPEGIKGAEAVAAAIFMAKSGKSKEDIRKFIAENYYNLDFTLDSIRAAYRFEASCQRSVPQAIVAFLESYSFEDAIRGIVSIGGDTDTTAAISGSIAWAYYTAANSSWSKNQITPEMSAILDKAKSYLPQEFIDIEKDFHEMCHKRHEEYDREGSCTPLMNNAEMEKNMR